MNHSQDHTIFRFAAVNERKSDVRLSLTKLKTFPFVRWVDKLYLMQRISKTASRLQVHTSLSKYCTITTAMNKIWNIHSWTGSCLQQTFRPLSLAPFEVRSTSLSQISQSWCNLITNQLILPPGFGLGSFGPLHISSHPNTSNGCSTRLFRGCFSQSAHPKNSLHSQRNAPWNCTLFFWNDTVFLQQP